MQAGAVDLAAEAAERCPDSKIVVWAACGVLLRLARSRCATSSSCQELQGRSARVVAFGSWRSKDLRPRYREQAEMSFDFEVSGLKRVPLSAAGSIGSATPRPPQRVLRSAAVLPSGRAHRVSRVSSPTASPPQRCSVAECRRWLQEAMAWALQRARAWTPQEAMAWALEVAGALHAATSPAEAVPQVAAAFVHWY